MEFADKQASSSITLDDGRVLTACDQCREMHAERNPPTEPPCFDCRVIPNPKNMEAFKIFRAIRYQIIFSPASAVDVYHEPIHSAMDLYKIKNREACFEKLLILNRWWIAKLNKKDK